jgi:steroid delta-isomerase-like uncharacterized protein
MSHKNLALLQRSHQAFSRGDLATTIKLVAPNCVLTDHGRNITATGHDQFRGWLESFYAMSSDMNLVDAQYIDAGNTVVAQFRAVGTQDGPMDAFPPSHKPYSLDVCEIWHFNDKGEAIEGHNYSDGLGLLMQLGHIPMPEMA